MKKIFYWFPSIIIASAIFILSSRPRVSITEKTFIDFIIFKTGHIIEYGVFFVANFRAVKNSLFANKLKAVWVAFIITIIYAFSDELHQTLVPTREGRLRDVGFDTIGATLALFFIWNLQHIAPKKLIKLARKLEIT